VAVRGGRGRGMAHASKSLTSGDMFGWRDPVLPPDGPSGSWTASSTGSARRHVSCWCRTRRSASRSCWARPAIPSASSTASRNRRRRGRDRPRERSHKRRLHRGPDGLCDRHGPRAVSAPCAFAGPRPCAGSSRATSSSAWSPATSSSTSTTGIARYEQMLRRGEQGQERDYLSSRSRRATGSSSPWSRSTASAATPR